MKAQTMISSTLVALLAITIPALAAPKPARYSRGALDTDVEPLFITGTNNVELPIAPMVFSGQFWEGGPELSFTGTLQEIIPQVQAINPDWTPEGPTPTTSNNKPTLVERYFKNRPTCWWRGDVPAPVWVIDDIGVPYLKGLTNVQCGTAAQTCARCFCDIGAAIFLCNEQNTFLNIPCPKLGGAAHEIRVDCIDFFEGQEWTEGRWVNTDGYFAFVKKCYD